MRAAVWIRTLQEADLDQADEVCRVAFGTFVGAPEPETFFGTADYVRGRWAADPDAAFAAIVDGAVVGSNFATNWGSVGYFGPLSVRPDLWDSGVGRALMAPVMDRFTAWGTRHAGLFTFAQSPKHVELYRRFGFWPRFLTAVMRKPVGARGERTPIMLAELPDHVTACRALTDAIYDGLDLTHEIEALQTRGLGDTVLLSGDGELDGMAVCHQGAGSEAGADVCLIKFGAVRPGSGAAERFMRLLDECERYAVDRGAQQLEGGVNLARTRAYAYMVDRGFRTMLQGVAMHRPNEPAYSHPDAFVIDDWR